MHTHAHSGLCVAGWLWLSGCPRETILCETWDLSLHISASEGVMETSDTHVREQDANTTVSERDVGTWNRTFYGVEVRTGDVSHYSLLLMGGAHVNLRGDGRKKHDTMLKQATSKPAYHAHSSKACQVTTAAISSYKWRWYFIDPWGGGGRVITSVF